MHELTSSARFRQNLYRWALADWEAELTSGCSRLLSLPSTPLHRIAAVLLDRTEQERRAIAVALLKRAHQEAVASLGLRLEPRERALLDSLRPRPLLARRKRPSAIDRGALRRAVVAMVGAVAGEVDSSYEGSAEWRHVRQVAHLRLVTYVDTGGAPWRQVEFMHDVHDGAGQPLIRLVSLSSWLGISSGLRFDCIEPGQEVAAAEAAAGVVAHFADALPGLCA